MAKPNPTVSSLVLSAGLLMLTCLPLSGQSNPSSPTPIMGHVINFTISPPFSELAKMPPPPRWNFHEEEKVRRVDFHPGRVLFPSVDPVEQSSPGTAASFTVGLNLLGLDNSAGLQCHPPDTNAAVGDTQVVEWVNVAYEIFNKTTGAIEAGPILGTRSGRAWADPAPTIMMATSSPSGTAPTIAGCCRRMFSRDRRTMPAWRFPPARCHRYLLRVPVPAG